MLQCQSPQAQQAQQAQQQEIERLKAAQAKPSQPPKKTKLLIKKFVNTSSKDVNEHLKKQETISHC
ncbi:MAG: hypothetical protein WCF23_03440 [Candidatus Nitrosopolaris sp.]